MSIKRNDLMQQLEHVRASLHVDIESVKAHCKEGLTAYKLPREFELIDDIPKSIIGKILHRELRDRA